MLNRHAVWVTLAVALLGSWSSPGGAADKKRANPIKVVEATYGGNCPGVAKGNATELVAAACADNDLCNYRVYYKQLGGDPSPGCDKDFKVTYSCGRSTRRNSCELPAEAGKGGEDGYPNQFCLLHCLSTSGRDERGEETDRMVTGTAERPRVSPAARAVQRYHVERLPDGRFQISGPFYGPWP